MPRSSLIELFSRVIKKQSRKDKIYTNGADNLYPERIERVINNSVTSKLAVNKMIDFINGLGFREDLEDVVINKKKNRTFGDLRNLAAKDVAYQKGFFLHLNYDLEGTVNYLDVLKFKNCRVSEEDDFGNKGYVWHSKDWDNSEKVLTRSKNNKNWFYPYNPDINVINAQRRQDAKKNASPSELIKSYRGQVLFVNLEDDKIYPEAYIDAAYNDADTEYHISAFRNNRIKNGFLGANVVVVPESGSDGEELVTDEQLKGLLGSENTSNILKLEITPDGDKKLEDYIHIETIKSEVDTEQFQYDEKIVQENILNSFKNVPKILVKNSDSTLFGTSGEALEVAERIYQRNTEHERKVIQKAFEKVFKNHDQYNDFEIIKVIKDDNVTEEDGADDNIED